MNSPTKIQTVGEATSSIKGAVGSTFDSLANLLNISQLKDSFFQNIIFILIVIIILVGILVYIQMVGPDGNDPLNSPPTRVIKKVEIKKIVEGFNVTDHSTDSIATHAETTPGDIENNSYNHDEIHLAQSESYDEENRESKNRKRH